MVAIVLLPFTKGCSSVLPMLGIHQTPVIMVAGQSNAVGQGDPNQEPAIPGVSWQGMPNSVPRGIGMSFGQEYLHLSKGRGVIIAMCAVGGTSITQWQPGGELFSQCTALYKTIRKNDPSARIAGILFWQGEADTTVPGTPWAQKFTETVNGFRTAFHKQVPVVFAQLDPVGSPDANWSAIMAQQESINIAKTKMVKTSDVQMFVVNEVHVSAPGLKIIGERMAQAYFDLLKQ